LASLRNVRAASESIVSPSDNAAGLRADCNISRAARPGCSTCAIRKSASDCAAPSSSNAGVVREPNDSAVPSHPNGRGPSKVSTVSGMRSSAGSSASSSRDSARRCVAAGTQRVACCPSPATAF